jgi:DNA polymerase-3 subunit delta'
MILRPIYGHEAMLDRLAGALASSRFPQAVLFVGAPGVGKQRLALWVAQGLLCSDGPGKPCGECRDCHQVLALQHPDVHWFVPIERPKGSDQQKQVEQAAELLAEAMQERRKTPFYGRPEGMTSHSLAPMRVLQRAVAMKPFQGSRKVIILGDAERLTVQASSEEAANALLKVLEEPPDDTVIILTASEPQALLDTIRSRLVPIRIGRVGDDAIRAFLERELEPAPQGDALERRTVLAEGSIGRALWADDEGEGGDRAAEELLAAISRGPQAWAQIALKQQPWAARGEFSTMLDALAVKLRDRLVRHSGTADRLENWLEALRLVEETRATARRNVNPQLALAALAVDLERLL